MFWIGVVIVVSIIAASLDSSLGKIVVGAAVIAIGVLILNVITEASFLITLAKACAVVIVITIVGTILLAIIGD